MPPQDCRPLTPRQIEVLEFIVNYLGEHGYAPAHRDIQRHLGSASPNGVVCHLDALEEKGYLRRTPNGHRTIEVLAGPIPSIRAMLTVCLPYLPAKLAADVSAYLKAIE